MATSLDQIKDTLDDILEKVDNSAPFAFCNNLVACPNPGLDIADLGTIGLPLSERDAQTIISKAKQSPFGHKDATIVDTTVRKSWELNPSQFSLRNPSWQIQIQNMVSAIHQGLRLKCSSQSVTAELYKLLLYEPGAFFKAHKDSEKTRGMFGTLIVCLPSAHQGGKLVLRHNGAAFEHETQTMSEFNFSFAAWYSNITHEVLPVTSGYRLVLTYNLVQRTTGVPMALPASSIAARERQLGEQLLAYKNLSLTSMDAVPEFLIYKLGHKYTQASLHAERLKSEDYDKAHILRNAAQQAGFELYLASMERTMLGDEDDDTYFEPQEEEIKHIVDLEGNIICKQMPLPQRSVIGAEPDVDDHDESEHEGWTGNEGAPITYWYRDTVLVIVPRYHRMDFRYNHQESEPKLIEQMRNLKKRIATDADAENDLVRLCQLSTKTPARSWDFSYNFKRIERKSNLISEALCTLLELDQYGIFDECLKRVESGEMLQCVYQLALAIVRVGFSTIRPRLETAMQRAIVSIEGQEYFMNSIEEYLKAGGFQGEQYLVSEFSTWREAQILNTFRNRKALSVRDGEAMSALVLKSNLEEYLKEICEKIETCPFAARVGFWNAFVESRPWQDLEHQSGLVETGFQSLWTDFRLSTMAKNAEDTLPVYTHVYLGPNLLNAKFDNFIKPNDLVRLVNNSLNHGTKWTVTSVCDTLEAAGSQSSGKEQFDVMIKFLHLILENAVPAFYEAGNPNPACQKLFQTVLVKYIRDVAGKMPQRPKDFKRQMQPCSMNCQDCSVINNFLDNRSERSFDFPVGQQRIKHLNSNFDSYANRGKSYRLETIKDRRPFTFRITKNNDAYSSELKRWEQNFAVVQRSLQSLLGLEQRLEDYLGPHFANIMSGRVEQIKHLSHTPLSSIQPKGFRTPDRNKSIKRRSDDSDIENSQTKRMKHEPDVSEIAVIDLTQ